MFLLGAEFGGRGCNEVADQTFRHENGRETCTIYPTNANSLHQYHYRSDKSSGLEVIAELCRDNFPADHSHHCSASDQKNTREVHGSDLVLERSKKLVPTMDTSSKSCGPILARFFHSAQAQAILLIPAVHSPYFHLTDICLCYQVGWIWNVLILIEVLALQAKLRS